MSNNEFIEKNYNLLKTCIDYQTTKYNCPSSLKDDLFQEICLIILNYPQDKLNDVVAKHHENAWISGVLLRTLYSTNSQFYRVFRKFSKMSDNIDDVGYKY